MYVPTHVYLYLATCMCIPTQVYLSSITCMRTPTRLPILDHMHVYTHPCMPTLGHMHVHTHTCLPTLGHMHAHTHPYMLTPLPAYTDEHAYNQTLIFVSCDHATWPFLWPFSMYCLFLYKNHYCFLFSVIPLLVSSPVSWTLSSTQEPLSFEHSYQAWYWFEMDHKKIKFIIHCNYE